MSGEAGAVLQGELYSLFVGSGMMVSVAPPPGADGSYIGQYFERESQPFREWLERARPQLDALFAQLVTEGEPIVPLAQPFEEIDGTFLEDDSDKHFAKYHKGGPLSVRLSGSRHMPDRRSLNLHFLVATRVEKRRMEAIVERVAKVLLATQEAPQPPPEPPAPVVERRSFWARLFGR